MRGSAKIRDQLNHCDTLRDFLTVLESLQNQEV